MKISVIYDSKTANTETMANYIVAGMEKVDGVDAKGFNITDLDEEFIQESGAVVFGCPTYMAGPSADFYDFLEKKAGRLGLAGKLGGVFATQQYIHGGADLTMVRILEHLLVFGMMIYSGGGSKGAPVIHIGPVEISPDTEAFKELFETYGTRFAEQAVKVNG